MPALKSLTFKKATKHTVKNSKKCQPVKRLEKAIKMSSNSMSKQLVDKKSNTSSQQVSRNKRSTLSKQVGKKTSASQKQVAVKKTNSSTKQIISNRGKSVTYVNKKKSSSNGQISASQKRKSSSSDERSGSKKKKSNSSDEKSASQRKSSNSTETNQKRKSSNSTETNQKRKSSSSAERSNSQKSSTKKKRKNSDPSSECLCTIPAKHYVKWQPLKKTTITTVTQIIDANISHILNLCSTRSYQEIQENVTELKNNYLQSIRKMKTPVPQVDYGSLHNTLALLEREVEHSTDHINKMEQEIKKQQCLIDKVEEEQLKMDKNLDVARAKLQQQSGSGDIDADVLDLPGVKESGTNDGIGGDDTEIWDCIRNTVKSMDRLDNTNSSVNSSRS